MTVVSLRTIWNGMWYPGCDFAPNPVMVEWRPPYATIVGRSAILNDTFLVRTGFSRKEGKPYLFSVLSMHGAVTLLKFELF